MEKNWIKEIKEAVRVAMNKGLKIQKYYYIIDEKERNKYYYRIYTNNDFNIDISIEPSTIILTTPKGRACFNVNLTKRDFLELDAISLSIEEYNEDMAISEFEEFISDKKKEITNINDLDNDEE